MTRARHPALKKSILIVAHPDDEVLWFGSLLGEVEKVIIVFQDYNPEPNLGAKRVRAIAELPFNVTALAVPEAGSFQGANWSAPTLTSYGLELQPSRCGAEAGKRYRENFDAIRATLAPVLCGDMNVYSHNPWGEYGHEDHVQVCRVVQSLCDEIGFTHRVPTYISERSRELARSYRVIDTADTLCARINRTATQSIANIYKQRNCWTWADDWYWDEEECFVRCPVYQASHPVPLPDQLSPLLRRIPASVQHRLPV